VLGLRLLHRPGKIVLAFRGDVLAGTPVTPALDPAFDGVRFELVDALGNVRDELTLAPGTRDRTHPIGWSADRKRVRWRYADPTGAGRVHSAQVVIDETTGRVRVRLTASRGNSPLTAADAPITIRVLAGTAPRRCGELAFRPPGALRPACKFSRTGTSAQCR
jgi:hypothetical protein